jgi:hypothetical protein
MSIENPLLGAPRIHGELLKLGFSVDQASSNTCSSGVDRQARDGTPFCKITPQISLQWICSLYAPLTLSCSMAS